MQTLQEQLDDFPSGYIPVILECVHPDGHMQEFAVPLWDAEQLLKGFDGLIVPQPMRQVMHSVNDMGKLFGGATCVTMVRVYRLYKEAL